MPFLSNGQYRIFNANFTTQDADLLFGQPSSIIGGYVNNSNTFNMVWNLKNVDSDANQFTLTNAVPSANGTYASIDGMTVGANVRGSTNKTVWTIVPTLKSGYYWILAPTHLPSELVWSLSSEQDFAPIKLAHLAYNDLSQIWTFQPQAEKVGNAPRRLNDLD
ncbi:hypothetical protein JVT61DRAFT_8255 [Boletus reticuloceps]|uniref:Uncharacterized protein n=1 Tax=Boletus reticuloceps TaxID=495285 RepID=A0A8I3AF88_9AGAM|nr:hypothetical protein JVT61DRAFT_8255 [Boletus reticuloceps]